MDGIVVSSASIALPPDRSKSRVAAGTAGYGVETSPWLRLVAWGPAGTGRAWPVHPRLGVRRRERHGVGEQQGAPPRGVRTAAAGSSRDLRVRGGRAGRGRWGAARRRRTRLPQCGGPRHSQSPSAAERHRGPARIGLVKLAVRRDATLRGYRADLGRRLTCRLWTGSDAAGAYPAHAARTPPTRRHSTLAIFSRSLGQPIWRVGGWLRSPAPHRGSRRPAGVGPRASALPPRGGGSHCRIHGGDPGDKQGRDGCCRRGVGQERGGGDHHARGPR